MVIKSYLGESVAEALKKIRSELGPKAMVLKTRALNASESGMGRRMVEITACLEKPTVGALDASLRETPAIATAIAEQPVIQRRLQNATAIPHEESRVSAAHERTQGLTNEEYARRLEEKLDLILDRQERPSLKPAYPESVSEVGHALLNHDIPERFVRPLLVRLSERTAKDKSANPLEVAERLLTEEFAQYCIPDFSLKAGDRALFIGPSGCGKTTALGKMAAELLFKRRIKTELSTLDDFRVAAQEEIAGYSEALGAALVDSAGAMESFSEKTNRALLIDCHSNINDQRQFMGLL
ncbi:MAG TPA: hypothetical protein VLB27_00790, partial [candidate division Zixibacteria bacterium]|nr:hypothetical protein [candidate division Zixibacteria bacterium]